MRAVTISYFLYTIIMAKQIYDNDIAISLDG